MLARDHRTPIVKSTLTNATRGVPSCELRCCCLLNHGLDHPARRGRRGHEHRHDGTVRAQQAVMVEVGLLPRALVEGEVVL